MPLPRSPYFHRTLPPADALSSATRFLLLAYQDEDWVLKDINLTIEPGETIALVGHTGAGKTTLIGLMLRFYDVQQGQVLVDGVDVAQQDARELRRRFGVVLQDPFLFHGDHRK